VRRVRTAPEAADDVAEAAFVVDPALRNRGLGTALLEATVLAARNRGHRAIRVICLRDNWPMRRLAQKAEAGLMLTFDEMHGEIRTPAATPLSLMREAVGDALDATGRLMAPPAA
jgi:GNAT superfamily N-acetyltransferase